MKLKKVNEDFIVDLQDGWLLQDSGDKIILRNTYGVSSFEYTCLEEFAKEWQTVKEPLLKGELKESFKIWAKLNNISIVQYNSFSNSWSTFMGKNLDDYYVTYEIGYVLSNLEEKEYDIKELVGE